MATRSRFPRYLFTWLLALCALAAAGFAHADKWALPTEQQVLSANGTARVTIAPRALSSQLDYFSDATHGKDKPGQAPGARNASAHVEVRGADGRWRTLWRGPLVNDVAPVSALLADDGSHLVTFDNWHTAGYGEDVVVIYDAAGKVVRQWSLAKLLSPAYVATLPHSVSSIWWRGKDSAIVDGGRTLLIDVVVPGSQPANGERTAALLVALRDGLVVATQRPEWRAALRQRDVVDARRRQAWREYRTARAAPLHAPATRDTAAWRAYLDAARERLAWQAKQSVRGVLVADDGSDAASAVRNTFPLMAGWGEGEPRHVVFASPDGERLATLLQQQFAAAKPASLAHMQVWMSGTDAQVARVRRAALASGAVVEGIGVGGVLPGINLPADPPERFNAPLPASPEAARRK
jgi:hypothetical protein